MSKKIVIIASLYQEDDIKTTVDYYTRLGYVVDYPKRQPNKNFADIVEDYLRKIYDADLVVAITKNDGTFGEGATYELAFAEFFGKRIVTLHNTKQKEKQS